MERRPVAREPAIDRFLYNSQRPQPVGTRHHGPAASHLTHERTYGRGSLRPSAVLVDSPGGAIRLLAGDPVAGEGSSFLIGDCQHTAGPVAPADPARHPGSNASSPVEEEDEVGFAHACSRPTHPSSSNTSAFRSPWTRAIVWMSSAGMGN